MEIVLALPVTLGLCRFLKIKYAMGTKVALIHDVFITIGALYLTNRDISLPIIAGLPTIVGYLRNNTNHCRNPHISGLGRGESCPDRERKRLGLTGDTG